MYRDSFFTFDRTDSYELTKDIMCTCLWRCARHGIAFILLQSCHTFWLFLYEVTEKIDYDRPVDYAVSLLAQWKNYHKQRSMLKMDVIRFPIDISSNIRLYNFRHGQVEYDKDRIIKMIPTLQQAIDQNEFTVEQSFNCQRVDIGGGKWADKHIPLLKSCGIARYVNAIDLYIALEEYFALENQSAERTESVDLTDKDKITNHGFDMKSSFRGK